MAPVLIKILLITLVSAVFAIGLYFVFLSYVSKPVYTGISNGKLGQCGSKPNCVNSEYPGERSIEAISVAELATDKVWHTVKLAITSTGGNVIEQTDNYLRAEYTSTIFRFVDDLEMRWDTRAQLLHIRSGSRSGTSDFDVNRKRVEAIRRQISK